MNSREKAQEAHKIQRLGILTANGRQLTANGNKNSAKGKMGVFLRRRTPSSYRAGSQSPGDLRLHRSWAFRCEPGSRSITMSLIISLPQSEQTPWACFPLPDLALVLALGDRFQGFM